MTIVATPEVIRIGKLHFNCLTFPGLPLEDEGDAGSAGSHWEKVALGNEFMVSNDVENPVISKFSLALLVDSGWY
jgi:Leishmanolysin